MKHLFLLALLALEVSVIVTIGADRLSLGFVYAIVEQAGALCFLAFGMSFVLMTAGIDLSVGSMTALVICSLGSLFGESFHWYLVPSALAIGACLGAFNGLLVARLDMPPIIATLGTLFLFRGLCWVTIGDGETSIPFHAESWERFGEWPTIIVMAAIVFGVGGAYLSRSRWRREILMIGGNLTAARYAGIRVSRRLVEVYTLVGILAAISAFVFIGTNGSVQGSSLTGLELQVIVATVLGGTRVQGGAGSLLGTLLGVLVVVVMNLGLQGLNSSSIDLPFRDHYLRYILLGGLLVVGVWLNTYGSFRVSWFQRSRS